eukprot:CAMPEP_0197079328 /NCGR_PEP_ID=MMETSP1384-20130603/213571_1 /TAXON_ID=29189 /ORGANISM="Ammonia sp." /LENGTH=568 /DNA_ID=CAMNT_0042518205 /DNA_START=31 /DNA_END=1737 /DNA_ORIENTATION=+
MANRKASPSMPSFNKAKSSPVPSVNVNTSLAASRSFDRSVLSPPGQAPNSWQRQSIIQTNYGKSPVTLSDTDNTLQFDYNIFVTTWQDQIKLRQYEKCEKYCREVIEKLLAAEQQHQLLNTFGGILNHKKKPSKGKSPSPPPPAADDQDEEMYTLLEYRSKVHFSLAYLLKKYFKRYAEAREQYEESIKTDKENPGAHFNLANMLVDYYKDFKTAEFHFERAISLEPTYALYRMTYAEFLWHDCGRYKDSAFQYEELIKYYSENYDEKHQNEDIYFNYGLLLRDHLKDIPKALKQFKYVLDINPNDNEANEEYQYTLTLQSQITENEHEDVSGSEADEQTEQAPVSMKVSVIAENQNEQKHAGDVQQNETTQKDHSLSIPLDVHDLLNDNNNNNEEEAVAELDSKAVRTKYQKDRKRSSAFRRSQHEIVLPNMLSAVDEEESKNGVAMKKYHQVVDERNKLNIILKQQQQRQRAMNTNVKKMKRVLLDESGGDFKKELNLMVQNGANYVEANPKQAHRLLRICKNLVEQLDSIHIAKSDGVKQTSKHDQQRSDSDIQYDSRDRNASVV